MNGVQWIVTQIEARERYAVPRAFQVRGHLHHFYTDIWCGRGASILKHLPRGDAVAHRFHSALPPSRVTGFNFLGARCAARRFWRGRPKSMEERYAEFVWIGKQFAERVNRRLAKAKFDRSSTAAFLFNTGALETCRYLRTLGVPIVLDQLDPGRVDEQMVQAEMQAWPGWEEFPGRVPELYYQRIAEEWRLADLVLVNSNWSRTALLQQGVEARKMIVVPLCYEPDLSAAPVQRPKAAAGPLTVLWIGQIVLRKGIPYLFEAARKLLSANVRFIVAGRVGISAKGLAAAPRNVSVIGRISHSEAARHFSEADVFVLPTISDGFALTQLEAMSFGLPVITTPNCGDVVTHGSDGLMIPPRDSQALADAIASLEGNRPLLREMSARALQTVRHPRFSLDGYADAVENALASYRQMPATAK
jgi:glycosyltransferase involved in cell wall biosynthesis